MNNIKPFLKWVGGKSGIATEIIKLFPSSYDTYCEPLLGGGAVFFLLEPTKAIIGDINNEMIHCYNIIKNDVDKLIDHLKIYENNKDEYSRIRSLDRNNNIYSKLSDIEKAGRILFLNKTCFNGLYRVNSKNQYNTSYGKYNNPNIVNETILRAVSKYLNSIDVKIISGTYKESFWHLPEDSIVYLDPPYDPISSTSNFVNYTSYGFNQHDHTILKLACDDLTKKGIKFVQSNSKTKFILHLYRKYNIETIMEKRSISGDATKRIPIESILIYN